MQDKKPEVLTPQFCEDFGYTMLPVGVPIPWPSETPPDGWLKCNGEIFDTERYPKLALAYPSGRLPDLRGEFIRGWDDERGVDTPRQVLSWQKGSLASGDIDNSVASLAHTSQQGREKYGWDDPINVEQLYTNASIVGARGMFDKPDENTKTVTGYVGVTRPRNIAFNYIVRAA